MILFRAMEPIRNVFFWTPSFCVHIWSRVELFSEAFNIYNLILVHLKICYYRTPHFV